MTENALELKTRLKEEAKYSKSDGTESKGMEMHSISGSVSLHVKACPSVSEILAERQVEILKTRIETAENLLSYLKSKAKIMSVPRYALISCGLKVEEGVGLVDRRGIRVLDWQPQATLRCGESFEEVDKPKEGPFFDSDSFIHNSSHSGGSSYVESITLAVSQVTDVMEVLLKRALIAEAKYDIEREKVKVTQFEVKRKSIQVESMWAKVEEMEKVALSTTGALKEMQYKLRDMEVETTRQRIKACENEQELSKVRHDFDALKSRLGCLTKARDAIRSLERCIEVAETTSKSLSNHVACLEAERLQDKDEIVKLLAENDALSAGIDFKEAELSALRDQVKKFFSRT